MAETRTIPLRVRWNLRLLTLGVLAICLGGLGAALLYSNLSHAESAIVLTRTVYRDQVISAEDLAVTSVVPAAGVATVPEQQLAQVVGATALIDLAEGGLLAPGSFGEPLVELGQVRVGLRLVAGRLPAAQLSPGVPVLLVPLGRDGSAPPPGASIPARIALPAASLPDGAAIVDVTVPAAEGERVARLAAGDQLALVRQAGEQR